MPGWNNNYFTGATNKLVPRQGDVLSTYVLVDPCNPPREVMLQYHDGSRWLAVFWGENLMAAGKSEAEAKKMILRTIPRGTLITPREVASIVGYLVSDEAAGISGQAIQVSGGESA